MVEMAASNSRERAAASFAFSAALESAALESAAFVSEPDFSVNFSFSAAFGGIKIL
jgi:hypothetical protein